MFPGLGDGAEVTPTIRAGLDALGIERLALVVHDSSFPSAPDEDIGRGSPYGKGARELIHLAAGLGFDALQLGPQGATTLGNPSPYDGAHLTKDVMSLALATLAEDEAWTALCRDLLPPLVTARPSGPADRTQHEHAWRAARTALETLYAAFAAAGSGAEPLVGRFEAFRARWAASLEADGIYEALTATHGTDDWRRWPTEGPTAIDRDLFCPADAAQARLAEARRAAVAAARAVDLERHLFGQFVLDEQHRALRAVAGAAGVVLFGDLQIGVSHRDVWRERGLFRADYLMGAPPSRTNPQGQPWGYPVIGPAPAPARARGALPRGSIACSPTSTAFGSTTRTASCARGFTAPTIPIPRRPCPRGPPLLLAGLARPPGAGAPRHSAARAAVDRSQRQALRRRLGARARRRPGGSLRLRLRRHPGARARRRAARRRRRLRGAQHVALSPAPRDGAPRPRPLCVTQKADLARGDDVYRSENASPRDWIMVGNHDTRSLWRLADAWHGTAAGVERALALAHRLSARVDGRPRLARWIAADARHLAQAMFAELFVGPARRVSMFFADWLGLRDIYNRPGVVHPDNWRLRIRPSFAEDYRRDVARGDAFNPPLALALALAARGDPANGARVHALVGAARRLWPSLDPELVSWLEDPGPAT